MRSNAFENESIKYNFRFENVEARQGSYFNWWR